MTSGVVDGEEGSQALHLQQQAVNGKARADRLPQYVTQPLPPPVWKQTSSPASPQPNMATSLAAAESASVLVNPPMSAPPSSHIENEPASIARLPHFTTH